jgi:hypothetical protein
LLTFPFAPQLVPQFVATLGIDGEVQIGLQRSFMTLSDFFLPETRRLFLSFIEDTSACELKDGSIHLSEE